MDKPRLTLIKGGPNAGLDTRDIMKHDWKITFWALFPIVVGLGGIIAVLIVVAY